MEKLKESLLLEFKKIRRIKGIIPKIEYIWEYYWYMIAAIVFLVCFVTFSINSYFNSVKEYWFYITFANTRVDIGTNSDLYNAFVDHEEFDLTKKNVEFNNTAYFDYGVNETGNTYFESFVTYADAGTLDAITMPCDSLELLGQSGRLLDLDSEKCASIKAKYGDRFIYSVPFNEEYNGKEIATGIDISDSKLMSEYKIYEDSCAIGIGAHSGNIDAVEDFLDYIFEE